MSENIKNGTRRTLDDKDCIYYDGYWMRYYAPPDNTLATKYILIRSLTRRTFHHTEPGINTPGRRLEEARRFYDAEHDPGLKRVNGAMLAGALFNRATDIFMSIMEIEEKGVSISTDNELMRQCGECLKEAMELGVSVRHYSGHEGIDELWGEPLKAFSMTTEAFYESRYRKIAQTWRDIDHISDMLMEVIKNNDSFDQLADLIRQLCEAAKLESETMRTDAAIFTVWPIFVSTSERLSAFRPELKDRISSETLADYNKRLELVRKGKDLLNYLASARVPMPKSTRQFLDECGIYLEQRSRPQNSVKRIVSTVRNR